MVIGVLLVFRHSSTMSSGVFSGNGGRCGERWWCSGIYSCIVGCHLCDLVGCFIPCDPCVAGYPVQVELCLQVGALQGVQCGRDDKDVVLCQLSCQVVHAC